MFRRGERVPFAYVTEADRFRSNVPGPARRRRSTRETAGGVLLGLTIVGGLIGSLLLGLPALDPEHRRAVDGHSAASEGR